MLRFNRELTLDIFDYSGHKLCQLYDSKSNISGQATDVFVTSERNGWKELHFNLPSKMNTDDGQTKNFRLDYLKADYAIRAVDETCTDWYLISEPKITHNGYSQEISVVAGHVSSLLKQKNLTLVFSDDEGNNIGTPAELMEVILQGTGWYSGNIYEFKEDNGDVKRRSLTCDEKTGSFSMIARMCELFDAKPVYHGESYVPLSKDPGDMDTNYAAYCILNNQGKYVQLTEPATYEPETYYRYKVRSVDILPMNPFSVNKDNGLPEIFQEGGTIDATNVIELHYGVNLQNVTRTLNTENIVTKLHAYGSYGDKTDGYCSIGECEHTEYTYIAAAAIAVGEYGLFTYTDDIGTHRRRFLVSGQAVEIGDKLIFSTLDTASKIYMYNNTKEYAYFCDDGVQGTLVTADGSPTSQEDVVNMVNFIMDFTYYNGIGLFTESMLQRLAESQRKGPALRQAASEASAAFNDVESNLSEVIGNVDYCRIIPTTDSFELKYENDNGYLKINLDTENYKSGIAYRSDYYEREANQFQWRCATTLKPNGDPVNDSASVVYIVHNTDPVSWEKVYVKTINGIEVYENKHAYTKGTKAQYAGSFYEATEDIALNQDEEFTASRWKLITDLEPENITLWLEYSADMLTQAGSDRLYLFKANTVNGYLGSYEAMDESVLQTISNDTKVNSKEHPTYFIAYPEGGLEELRTILNDIDVPDEMEYAWCWVFDPAGEVESTLWFRQCIYEHMPYDMWCPVCFTGEEEPIPYPNCYWYDWRTGAAYYADYKETGAADNAELKYPQISQVTLTKYPLADLMPQNISSQTQLDHMITTYSNNCLYLIPDDVLEDINGYWLALYEDWKIFAPSNSSIDAGYVWTQFNDTDTASKAEERIGRNFGMIWAAGRQRDRYYQGLYTNYVHHVTSGTLPAGNYAFKTPYGTYWIFSTKEDTTSGGELNFNTSDGYLTQTTYENSTEKTYTAEVKSIAFDAAKYHPANAADGVSWETGDIDLNGGEITGDDNRSAYAQIYLGLDYIFKNANGAHVYFYNSKKRFIDDVVITSNNETVSAPGSEGLAGYIRIVTSDTNYKSIIVQYANYENALVQNEENFVILDCEPDTGSRLKSIPEFVKQMADWLDELYFELMPAKIEAQDAVTALDNALAAELGDIYREGYWQDSNYVDGDEDRLYKDAAEDLERISKPEAEYDISFIDPYGSNDGLEYGADSVLIVPWPDINISYAVHLVDPEISINEWAFIDKIEKCYDQPKETKLKINTDLTTISQHSFADVLENIANVASKLNARQSKYDKAVVGTGANGDITAARLEGNIDVNRVFITGAASGWRTDANGNQIFESADGESAMMLTGRGFAISDSKNSSGDWIWRTFGTGHGFTADEITAGFLSAERIQAGTITVDKLENGWGATIDMSQNGIIIALQTGKYDKYNGIEIDHNGLRLTTDLTDGHIFVPLTSEPSDWASNYTSYYRYSHGEYVAVDDVACPTFASGAFFAQEEVNSVQNLVSLGASGINLTSNAKVNIASGSGINIETGGTFTLASDNFRVDSSGNVRLTGTIYATGGEIRGDLTTIGTAKISGKIEAHDGQIGGWYITENNNGSRLWSGGTTNNVCTFVALDSAAGNDYAMWAGAESPTTTENNTTVYAPFCITKTGTLRATNAIISGNITAIDGLIGGWTLDSSGLMHAGSTTSYIALDPRQNATSYPYFMWAGDTNPETYDQANNTYTYAPFRVSKAGVLYADGAVISGDITATTGTIGGWTVDSDGLLHAGSTTAYVGLDPRSSTSYAFWAGAESPVTTSGNTTAYAPFCVTKTGVLRVTGAIISGTISAGSGSSIGGFTIGTSSMYTGSKSSPSTGAGVYVGTDGIGLGTTFSVTNAGSLSATSGNIGGWSINTGYLSSGSGTTYVRLDSTANSSYAIWAGRESPYNSSGLGSYAPFCVEANGKLHATNANISGTVTASGGKIGSWSIDSDGTLSTSWQEDSMVPAGSPAGTTITNTIKLNSLNGRVISMTSTGSPSTLFYVTTTGTIYGQSLSVAGTISSTTVSTSGNITASGYISATSYIRGSRVSLDGVISIRPLDTGSADSVLAACKAGWTNSVNGNGIYFGSHATGMLIGLVSSYSNQNGLFIFFSKSGALQKITRSNGTWNDSHTIAWS